MKKTLLTLSVSLAAVAAMAVPAKRGQWKVIKLADGTEIKAELKGDEFCSFWQAADGIRYVKDINSGVFKQTDISSLEAMAAPMRAASVAGRAPRKAARAVIGGDHNPYVGKKKGLVILVDFVNKKFDPTHTRDLFDRIANEEGFSELDFNGSVKDYFKAQSYGQFELDFDVVGPVSMKQRYGFYGAPTSDGQNDNYINVARMVADACKAVDPEVDFNDYDWDGDGNVDQVFIIYAGLGQADGGDVNTIWPHASNIQALGATSPELDGVKVNNYACSCELNGKYGVYGIGAMCHEFSHCLGLADMYDAFEGKDYGLWSYDIMDYGCYNGGAYVPAGYTSYERMYAGWLQPKELTDNCDVTAMNELGQGEAYVIYNDGNRDEYYLLENRQKTGWDSALDGAGLLVVHVDYNAEAWAKNVVNSTGGQDYYRFESAHPRCELIPADNNFYNTALVYVKGDVYPYKQNNSLTNTSLPAASLYNKNTDGSLFMNKPVADITQNADGTMSFSFRNENNPTGIGTVISDKADNSIYSLDGRYMGTDMNALKSGIYIVGGRKVLK